MEGNFEVYQNGQSVGTVALSREGLYYHIRCLCRPKGEAVSRLMWKCDQECISLGIPVPMAGGFGLDTRMAVKKCPGEQPEFILVEKGKEDQLHRPVSDREIPQPKEDLDAESFPAQEADFREESAEPQFIPIREEDPFPALEKLECAVLAHQDGQIGALISDPEETVIPESP